MEDFRSGLLFSITQVDNLIHPHNHCFHAAAVFERPKKNITGSGRIADIFYSAVDRPLYPRSAGDALPCHSSHIEWIANRVFAA